MNAMFPAKTVNPIRMDICALHGSYESTRYFTSIWTGCPVCEDAERIEREARERAEEANRQRRLAVSRIIATGIPERFREIDLDGYAVIDNGQDKARKFALRYAAEFGSNARSALFLGNVGTGKTHLGCGILLHLLRAGRTNLRYSTVQSLVQRVKSTFDRGASESETQALAGFVEADLLVLDEVGVQNGTDFERNTVYAVINGRYERRKPVIVISNLNIDELTDILGERVVDRLREDGGQMVPFKWGSYRRG